MISERTRPLIISLVLSVILVSGAITTAAQSDPDPNSPTPILISVENEPRIFAYAALKSRNYSLARKPIEAFPPNSRIVIFVGNIDLLDDEGVGAFRVYAEDEKGRAYRFPVLDVREATDKKHVYALTIQLTDDIGYWPTPDNFGDMVIRVGWRGLTSNQLLLGFGQKGVDVVNKRSEMKPSPVSSLYTKKDVAEEAPSAIGYRWSGDRIRFMEQATFGPTVALDQRLRRIGLRVWLGEQFDKPYPSPAYPYPDIPLRSSDSNNITIGCGMFTTDTPERRQCDRMHYSMYPLQNWFFQEALYGDAQLRHRVAWALSQIWVTSALRTSQSSWAIAYHKILAQNAFGNYRTLMKQMTQNPAMGNYLDMARSTRTNPNENYARELMQLFTIGLLELNIDGTLKRDLNNNPIPTYSQDTVNNFTKVFTGWTFCNTGCPNSATGITNYKDPLILTNQGSNHDLGAKTLFNYPSAPYSTIPACTGCTGTARETYATNSLDQALDNIFNHPNVGPFVSRILIQHLVTSDPSPAYVSRVASIFNNNGSGIRGDLRAVVMAILLDPEARGDLKTDPNFGKLREPVLQLTNLFRQIGVKGASQTGLSDGVINGQANNMGQNVFTSPTVFNYYSPQNMVPGTTLLGPEFQLMTTGTAIARANSMNTMIFSQIGVAETTPQGTSIDFSELQALAAADPTSVRLLNTLNDRMLHGSLTPSTKESIRTAVNAIPATSAANFLQRSKQAVYLIATSAQFQIQR